jgi:hypothetical protein
MFIDNGSISNNNTNTSNNNSDDKRNTSLKNNTTDRLDVCICNPYQYNYLWCTSWMFLATTFYTIYQRKYEFILCPGGIFLTSINYWKKPVYNSWQRNLDIIYVNSIIIYNILRSFGAENGFLFCKYIFYSFISYLISNYNQSMKRNYVSALLHSFVHLFCNIAFINLYSGHILPLCDNSLFAGFLSRFKNLEDQNLNII